MKIIDVASRNLDDLDLEKLKKSLRSMTTIVATPDDPVFAVAHEIDRRPGALAVVLGEDEQPIAVLVAADVKTALRREKGIKDTSLEVVLRKALSEREATAGNLQADLLQAIRPTLRWCSVHEHYTTPPCPYL